MFMPSPTTEFAQKAEFAQKTESAQKTEFSCFYMKSKSFVWMVESDKMQNLHKKQNLEA